MPADRGIIESADWGYQLQQTACGDVGPIAGLDINFAVGAGKGVGLTKSVLTVRYLKPPLLASYELEGN